MRWVDYWWFSLWAVIFSILVSSWVQAQALEPGGIFADGFETGDTCAWTREGCAPPAPDLPIPCQRSDRGWIEEGSVVELPGRTRYRVCCERGVVRICADTEVER